MENVIGILKKSLESVESEKVRRGEAILNCRAEIQQLESEYKVFDDKAKEIRKAIEQLEGKSNVKASVKNKKVK